MGIYLKPLPAGTLYPPPLFYVSPMLALYQNFVLFAAGNIPREWQWKSVGLFFNFLRLVVWSNSH